MSFRIGQGFDVHAFDAPASGSNIILGGVEIAHSQRLLAHSDGDVLLHALTDAVLGALALGDLGSHFPDTDSTYANIDSRDLLRHAVSMIDTRGYQLVNADLTIVAQQPKIAPYTLAMRKNIAADTLVDLEAISVKATTTEKRGFTGRGEGIACFAAVLLCQSNAG